MSEDPLLDLSVIVVNWNVCDLLRKCLDSLYRSPGFIWFNDEGAQGGTSSPGPVRAGEVIVVDNASADGSAAMVAAEFPWVRLVANTENRGFTGGSNQGIGMSRGRYLLLLNPDTEVMGDALARMVACMEEHGEIGALGPQLCSGDGSLQSSRRRFPTLATAFFESTPLEWHWPGNPWASRYRMEDVPGPPAGTNRCPAQMVDWVVGAALLVRRAALESVGGFDEGYFMYSEELDWCRRARAAGWAVAYFPGAVVLHHEGKSSEQNPAARHIRFHTSRVRYFRKHRGALAAEMLRLALLVMFAGEWVLEAAKWVLGSKRDLRRGRMRAYRQLLQTGLR